MTDTAERVALGGIPDVELIHVGTWQISTGEWTVTPNDLKAAVDALKCPAVREPVLKLGHEDPRFNADPMDTKFDGEPAVGWLTDMRVSPDGQTLLGDFVGMPQWLADVAASAYPDRSVEGRYDHVCQLGHTHPFVLTGVALLGVTPPGVGTLGSLRDIADLYGVAAAPTAALAGTPVTVRVHAGASPQVPPTAPVAGSEKGAGMDPAKIREALGLAPDSSDVELASALAAAAATLSAPAAETAPAAEAAPETPAPVVAPAPVAAAAPVLPEGVVAIDAATLEGLRVAASAGQAADQRLKAQDRDDVITAAVQAGKIAPSRRGHFAASWDADPEGTKAVLASLAPGLVPVAAKGYAGETETGDVDDAVYTALYGVPTGKVG